MLLCYEVCYVHVMLWGYYVAIGDKIHHFCEEMTDRQNSYRVPTSKYQEVEAKLQLCSDQQMSSTSGPLVPLSTHAVSSRCAVCSAVVQKHRVSYGV